jgi:hypothetical protein
MQRSGDRPLTVAGAVPEPEHREQARIAERGDPTDPVAEVCVGVALTSATERRPGAVSSFLGDDPMKDLVSK